MKAASCSADRRRRRDWFVVGPALLALLAGCEPTTSVAPTGPETTFEFDVRFDGKGQMVVFGKTSLPPKTILQGGLNEPRPSGLALRSETTVADGGTFEFPPLAVPPGRFGAFAMMRVAKLQPEPVLEAIGESGELLHGELVRRGPAGAFVHVEREVVVGPPAEADAAQRARALEDFGRLVELDRRLATELDSIEWVRNEARSKPTTTDPDGILQRWLVGHVARAKAMEEIVSVLEKSTSCPSLRTALEREVALVRTVVAAQGTDYFLDRSNVAAELETNRTAVEQLAAFLDARLDPAAVLAARNEATARADAAYRAPRLGEPIPPELRYDLAAGPPAPPLPETEEAAPTDAPPGTSPASKKATPGGEKTAPVASPPAPKDGAAEPARS
jgi:hypothetical protein